MISVITYCRRPMPKSIQERNVAKTVGTGYEYLVIDGSKGDLRFAAAYNWAVERTKGDILVFIADDLYFMNMNWGTVLETKFSADPSLGIIGVAGTQYLFADKYSLTAAGRPYIKGRIVYHLQNGDFFAAVFSPEKGDSRVVACEGCFLAVRAELFKKIRFDEQNFNGSHFHDLDFCLQAAKECGIIVTTDITVKKMSHPVYDAAWHAAGKTFLQKHRFELPASCAETAPDPSAYVSSQMVNLKGKTPQETIC